jgi:metal-dependent HD superfamily phosphatase/phosphodiesterase
MMLEAADLMHDPLVTSFIEQGNRHLEAIGYTDHGQVHVKMVSRLCREILLKLGYPERMAELAAIAGYLHDIGNVINRNGHSQAGALIAWELLNRMQMPEEETAVICSAIGNHDEGNGHPVNPVTAALILADKSHVHRNRVRNHDVATFDIHDRVNYAVEYSIINIDEEEKLISMEIAIDTDICPVMEYFEIFMSRMLMCRRAADALGCEFELIINGAKLI